MSAGQSQRSVASSTRRRQEAELAAAEERERAAAETAAAAARASRLAAAELAAARAEAEAAAAANAARAAAAEVEALRGSIGSSISADDTADADLELLEREAARARAAQWAAAHVHERGGSPDRRGRAGGAPGGGVHGNGGGRVVGERGLHRQRGSLPGSVPTGRWRARPSQVAWFSPRIGTVVTTGSRLLSGTSVPAVGGLPSPRPTTSSGLR